MRPKNGISNTELVPFKTGVTPGGETPSPADLYRALPRRAEAPAAIWLHQGDLLRAYHQRQQVAPADIAIELPTGAGKTLVGCLIAEWRRRAKQERVAYLCPTRQLARQVGARAEIYGINPVTLIGSHHDWNPASRMSFEAGRAVAITTYSTVFNSRPQLDSANVLILDDAHAAESYVSSPWSLNISRDDAAYHDVLAVLREAFDPLVLSRLETDQEEPSNAVHLASLRGVADASEDLEGVLATAGATDRINTSARHALRLMEGHLGSCLVYASYGKLLIRPMIVPTHSHRAFADATQRVYMSATLGDGGELERTFGRVQIARIPVPEGWDRQGTGRRFFCFPESTSDLATADAADRRAFIAGLINDVNKAAVLAPDWRSLEEFLQGYVPDGMPAYNATDIEDRLEYFHDAPRGLLTLANRYDGIDLPDQSCRLVVLYGLPAGGDLQERFLHTSLGALDVLQERIRTRVTQGAGRATRNSSDYAAVLMLSQQLTAFCARQDIQAAMHPEIAVELAFGLDNSLGQTSQEMRENLTHFFGPDGRSAPDATWQAEAETYLVSERNFAQRVPAAAAENLRESARFEVAAWQAAWQGEPERALQQARRVIDVLPNSAASLRPYQALWNYFASAWASEASRDDAEAIPVETARDYLRAARAAARGTTWLSDMAAPTDRLPGLNEDRVDPLDTSAAEAIGARLLTIGRPNTFEPAAAEMLNALGGTARRPYENALVRLGEFVGASQSTGDEGRDAAPDALWEFEDHLWVAWEAKSEAAAGGELGATDVRQVGSHLRYHASTTGQTIPSGSISIIVTPQTLPHPAASHVAEDHVYEVSPATVTTLASRIIRAWRDARTVAAGTQDQDARRAAVLRGLSNHNALPTEWLPLLTRVALNPNTDL